MTRTRKSIALVLLLAQIGIASAAEVKPAVEPKTAPAGMPDKPATKLDAPGEAIPGRSIRPDSADETETGTPMDRQSVSVPGVGTEKSIIPRSPLAEADRKFLMQAHQIGMAEIGAGNMALDKAQTNSVRTYAKMMVDDHSRSHDELKGLAEQNLIKLDQAMDAEHKQMSDALSKKKSGRDFERAYMADMVKGHEKAVAAFEAASQDSKDAEVKAYADRTLPTLRTHLSAAKGVRETLANAAK